METFATAQSIQDAQRAEDSRACETEVEAAALQNFVANIPRSQIPNALPIFLITLFCFSRPDWMILAGLLIAQTAAIFGKYWIGTRCDMARNKLAQRLYAFALFASGGLWAAMMLPVTSSFGKDETSSLMCIVIVATFSITAMAAANQKRLFAAFMTGFGVIIFPLTLITSVGGGYIFFAAFFGLFVILTAMTEVMRKQSRELIRARLEIKGLAESLSLSLKSAEYLARRDSLTGLLNRRAFEDVAHEIRDNNVDQAPMTMILIDLDHFKVINDRFGHGVGDEVLKSTANLIVETVGPLGLVARGDGAIARWGGEEFILLLNHCEIDRAIDIAESIRMKLAARRLPDWPRDIAVSGSFGIAAWPNEVALEMAIGHADEAMYSAKISGRNRTCLYRNHGCIAVERPGVTA